jgi:hypothetical protein
MQKTSNVPSAGALPPKLLFAGKVHQGLNPANRRALLSLLQPLANKDPRPEGVVLWMPLEEASAALPTPEALHISRRVLRSGLSRIPNGHLPVSRNRPSSLPSKVTLAQFLSNIASALTMPRGHGFLRWTKNCPFANLPASSGGQPPGSEHWGEGVTADEMADYTWLRPEIGAEIKFTEWIAGGLLRHAEFITLREL